MKYIINLRSQLMSGTTHWSGGVAPVHAQQIRPEISIAMSESVLTPHKSRITDEIARRLDNQNFITDEVWFRTTRVGSLEELMELLEHVE